MKTKKLNPVRTTLENPPALGQEFVEGVFTGLITLPNETHCAIFYMPVERHDKYRARDVTWQQAMDWAIEVGGELPSRPIAALLHANVKDKLQPEWYWCSDEDGTPYRWRCFMGDGAQASTIDTNATGTAISVRCIPMTGV